MSAYLRCWAFRGVLAVTLLAAVCAVGRAEDPPPRGGEDTLASGRAERREQAEACRRLVDALELTEAQARELLSLSDVAAGLFIEGYAAQAELLPQMTEAFADFAREDSLNRGFSPAVERRTARLSHEAKVRQETLAEKLIELEAQAAKILTPEQEDLVATFNPGQKAVRRRGLAPSNMARGNDKRKSGRSAERKARRNPDRRDDDLLARKRRKLGEVQQSVHPRAGTIGRYLLHPAAVESLCAITHARASDRMLRAAEVYDRGTRSFPIDQYDGEQARVGELRAEINNWNLINGLHLSLKQTARMVNGYDAFLSKREAIGGNTRKVAQRGAGRNRDSRAARVNPQQQAQQLRNELESTVERVLSTAQRQVLADYKACLVPPKNLKDPVRVGQANDHSAVEQWLTRVRRLPPGRLPRWVDETIDEEIEHFGPLNEAQRRERRTLLLRTARAAAKMSDVDFELDKAEMAERIAPRQQIDELRKQVNRLSRARGLPGPVAQFMLTPSFIAQLRQRGQQLADGIVPEPTELTDGPQAGNCEGGCALDPKGKKNKDKQQKSKKRRNR